MVVLEFMLIPRLIENFVILKISGIPGRYYDKTRHNLHKDLQQESQHKVRT